MSLGIMQACEPHLAFYSVTTINTLNCGITTWSHINEIIILFIDVTLILKKSSEAPSNFKWFALKYT